MRGTTSPRAASRGCRWCSQAFGYGSTACGERRGRAGARVGREVAGAGGEDGGQWGGRRNECIPSAGRHVHGDTLEGLVDTVAGIVNAALLAAGHPRPGGS